MRDSWRHLLSLGARTIHPGHGWPFPAEALALGRRSPRRGHPEARGRG
jgi:hypothetical protein